LCTQDIAGVTVGRSLIGGPGFTSGMIFSAEGTTGPVKITGDIVGGTGPFSGRVFGQTKLVRVTVGGSLIGGSLNDSGLVHSAVNIGPINIGHDVKGGSSLRSGFIVLSISAARSSAVPAMGPAPFLVSATRAR
jgi:hypothetical protein